MFVTIPLTQLVRAWYGACACVMTDIAPLSSSLIFVVGFYSVVVLSHYPYTLRLHHILMLLKNLKDLLHFRPICRDNFFDPSASFSFVPFIYSASIYIQN